MALNIANKRVEEKAKRVAALVGCNKTAAVEVALDSYLEQHGLDGRDREAEWREFEAAVKSFHELPVLDNRTPEEIIGYDEHGLPK